MAKRGVSRVSLTDGSSSSSDVASPTGRGREGAGVESETRSQEKPFVPDRVKAALEEAGSFDEFRRRRPFRFLHLYSGPRDVLAEALQREAAKSRMVVESRSIDRKISPEIDLAGLDINETLLREIDEGKWDYVHSGFPCGSFSRARHNPTPGQPPPVRDKANIHGYPGNSVAQQTEADRGSMMAVISGGGSPRRR